MDYKKTLNLPSTKFKMKASLSQREPQMVKEWERQDIYGRLEEKHKGRPVYLLHDGPPYANGNIHLGTVFNKVLKDIILKSKRMSGFHCPYIPGWDCHGLPIEHNVDVELGEKKKDIPGLSFREACRRYARKWIKKQKEEFTRLGVLGDWGNPYLTMNYNYEAAIAREFNRFLGSGSVVRHRKPVYWCSSCVTALAEAEVEYGDHDSPSIYVRFPFEEDLGDIVPQLKGEKTSAVIWTTTPWTIPANMAVALHPFFNYSAVRTGDDFLVIASELVETTMQACSIIDYEVVATFKAPSLEGRHCSHPLTDRSSVIVLADYVTLESGTGCVHTAPGHGSDDYLTGLRYGLEIVSPVDDHGRFTEEAGPYQGLATHEANEPICADLEAKGLLLAAREISHSYPHCWRCKKPVIFRATRQWFISMEINELRSRALKAIKKVNWTPSWGMERIYGMVESRPDWCLSRQRAWGVPITAVICRECGAVCNNEAINSRIDELFRKEGADAWFLHGVEDFINSGAVCPECGSAEFDKEEDILDVWFDSGVSYSAVLEERGLPVPADLYLEGSDQHRGWFQSSLLASVGTRLMAPYKGVLTHGFVVDGQGKKMSKSLGNVIVPGEIIKEHGAEMLRLWVSSEDYQVDIKISDEILKRLSEAYRKIRNTIRYMLGNLYDFYPATDRVDISEMDELDRWVLHRFELLKREVKEAYDNFEFHRVFHRLYNFCTVTMSSFYLDVQKDYLYVELPESRLRRSAQTALHIIADGLLRLMSPILSFTAFEAWDYLPEDPAREENVFFSSFPPAREEFYDEALNSEWEKFLRVRSEITRSLEKARKDKIIGHSLEADVRLSAKGEWAELLEGKWDILARITIVSALSKADSEDAELVSCEELPELSIKVGQSEAPKCERCWMRSLTVGDSPDYPDVCLRCSSVMARLEEKGILSP
ncbi:MAG: isoleucine--tRNA ligase [Thermodesulfobacteriota bacterium]